MVIRLARLWLLLSLGGCATATGWSPVIDTRVDRNPAAISQDLAECRQLALQVAGDPYGSTAGRTLLGGAVGAAAGAAIGAATGGSAGTGAAIGAATGGIGAGATHGVSREQNYKQAYINCLRGRGHQVLN